LKCKNTLYHKVKEISSGINTESKEGYHQVETKITQGSSDIGVAFRNVAELLNITSDDLLEELMSEYVE
jgi:molybdate-binding protein